MLIETSYHQIETPLLYPLCAVGVARAIITSFWAYECAVGAE